MALSLRWHYPGQVLRVAPIRRSLSAWLTKLPFSPMLLNFAPSVSRFARPVNPTTRLTAALRGWSLSAKEEPCYTNGVGASAPGQWGRTLPVRKGPFMEVAI